MRRRCLPIFALLALVVCPDALVAAEPDGRVAFRYTWVGTEEHGQPQRRLRLAITAFVPLEEAVLDASAPPGPARFLPSWAPEGLAIGPLAAGGSRIVDLDVAEPAEGGGILTFTLRALENGVPIRETVGIPVGSPGVEPVLRHGAAEFPAARDGTQP